MGRGPESRVKVRLDSPALSQDSEGLKSNDLNLLLKAGQPQAAGRSVHARKLTVSLQIAISQSAIL